LAHNLQSEFKEGFYKRTRYVIPRHVSYNTPNHRRILTSSYCSTRGP